MNRLKSRRKRPINRIQFWVLKNTHKKQVNCRHFCGTCEYYSRCRFDTENDYRKKWCKNTG